MALRELALFAGAGGGLLASKLLRWRTVAAVEIEPFCRDVLFARQRDGFLDEFPVWDDVRTFDGHEWRGRVDIVTGGFPCPMFSGAGKRLGGRDPRNRWPDMARILGEVRPRLAFMENSPDLLVPLRDEVGRREPAYFGRVLGDLAALGYRVGWDCVPASAVGAPHRRDRLWILAHADAGGCETPAGELAQPRGQRPAKPNLPPGASSRQPGVPHSNGVHADSPGPGAGPVLGERREAAGVLGDVSHPDGSGRVGRARPGGEQPRRVESENRYAGGGRWPSESGICRVAHGMAKRVDRIEALGNGQVPICAAVAFVLLAAALGAEE